MNKLSKFAAAPVAALTFLVQPVHAALPETVTIELSTMKTAGAFVAGAFLVAFIVLMAIKKLRAAVAFPSGNGDYDFDKRR